LIPDGKLIDRPFRGHDSSRGDISKNYDKLEAPLLKTEIAKLGRIGDAKTFICDARGMVELTTSFLRKNPDLFADRKPVPEEWY
jgi:aminoglycoside 3-N-acetyltransferase